MNGFHFFSSNRQEVLAQRLAAELTRPLRDPFEKEIVIVQSPGMERWISVQLARAHGIAANIDYPFPVSFAFELFKSVLDDVPEHDPFQQRVMVWKILEALPRLVHHPPFAPLQRYLEDGEPRKRIQLAERIASLFDRYLIFRPAMVLAWDRGDVSGEGGEHEHWQSLLWREISRGSSHLHRAGLKKRWHERLRHGPESAQGLLPERVSLFGISSLAPFYLDLFHHLSGLCRVNLFFLNPCREYWAEAVRASWNEEPGFPGLVMENNPLLASWGQLGGDFLHNVYSMDPTPVEKDLFMLPETESLLGMIQRDILVQGASKETEEKEGTHKVPATDRSVRVHSCHSPMREMEVLHDALLGLLEEDPGLSPRDIVVMTPDIEAYAPYIRAVFEASGNGRSLLPFSIADRDDATVNQAAQTFLEILDLAGTKLSASRVLSVLESPIVSARFELDQADLELIRGWTASTGIRWGIDACHRRSLGLPGYPEHSWRSGLDRLLLGYAMGGIRERMFQDILPFDQVEGDLAHTAGQLAEFCETLFTCLGTLESPADLPTWRQRLHSLITGFFSEDTRFATDTTALQQTLSELEEEARQAEFTGRMELKAVRHLLTARLREHGLGRHFISGGVTFCSMLPMRSIPFPVVCMVGMNHDAFPRKAARPAFDLMAENPEPGDRSPRLDDRYLFLEALLAARSHLHISHVGQSIEDNSPVPPSVLVSELLDFIADRFGLEQGPGKAANLVVQHRLQAFNPEYFRASSPLRSFSRENLRGAVVSRDQHPPEPFFRAPLPGVAQETDSLPLTELNSFLAHPVRTLLQRRLGIRLGSDEDPVTDQELLLHIEPLIRFQLGQDMTERLVRGEEPLSFAVARASQHLPPETMGRLQYEHLYEEAWELARRVGEQTSSELPRDIPFTLDVAGTGLHGTLRRITPGGGRSFRFARLKARDLLTAWTGHLTLCLLKPDGVFTRTTLLGLDGQTWHLNPVQDPVDHLTDLVVLFRRGLTAPLRVFPETSLAYARSRLQKNKTAAEALDDARREWTGYRYPGEGRDPYLQLAFRDKDDVLDQDFEQLALQVFEPVLDCLAEEPGQ